MAEMDNRMICTGCGWVGESTDLKDMMGYDEMCPACGVSSEDISWYSDEILADYKAGKFGYKKSLDKPPK